MTKLEKLKAAYGIDDAACDDYYDADAWADARADAAEAALVAAYDTYVDTRDAANAAFAYYAELKKHKENSK